VTTWIPEPQDVRYFVDCNGAIRIFCPSDSETDQLNWQMRRSEFAGRWAELDELDQAQHTVDAYGGELKLTLPCLILIPAGLDAGISLPYRVLHNGRVWDQEIWAGQPFKLLGFSWARGGRGIAVTVEDAVARPEKVIDHYPVFETAGGRKVGPLAPVGTATAGVVDITVTARPSAVAGE